jgi:plasmid stabilization system protein ParE
MATGRRRVAWSRVARDHLDDAIEYIAKESPSSANALLDRILDAAESLGEMSERGRVVPELRDPHTRELLLDPFRLIYHVSPTSVDILGLLHQRRDFRLWDRSEPT